MTMSLCWVDGVDDGPLDSVSVVIQPGPDKSSTRDSLGDVEGRPGSLCGFEVLC